MFDLDRWLKRLWAVNGVLLLALLVLGTGTLVIGWASGLFARDQAVVAPDSTPHGAATPRAVRFSSPRRIWGTTTRLVIVYYGKRPQTGPGLGSMELSSYSGEDAGPTVNLLFLGPDGAPGRVLFDRPAYVARFDYPETKSDSLEPWITYRVALEDTNGDGRLDSDDHAALWVSDVDGTNLRRVLPAGMRLLNAAAAGDGRHLVVTALEVPAGWRGSDDELRQRAFLYDVRAGTTVPYPALDSLVQRAARIVGQP
ncbi:MAG TPA: hypothetical protein VGQ25_01770 [Gemmatimonadales bacterium]|jgi:hypothetical protein|nr:hypothetical protein [Gemmatimonadales bacterium]